MVRMPALTSVLARSVAPVKSSATQPSRIAMAALSPLTELVGVRQGLKRGSRAPFGMIFAARTIMRGRPGHDPRRRRAASRRIESESRTRHFQCGGQVFWKIGQRLDALHPGPAASRPMAPPHVQVGLLLLQAQAQRQVRVSGEIRRRRLLAGQKVSERHVFPQPQFLRQLHARLLDRGLVPLVLRREEDLIHERVERDDQVLVGLLDYAPDQGALAQVPGNRLGGAGYRSSRYSRIACDS